VLRRFHGGVLLLKFLREDSQCRQTIFHFLKGCEHCLSVVGNGALVDRLGLGVDGFAFPAVKECLGECRTHGPNEAWPDNRLPRDVLPAPAEAPKAMVGKYAARATPICAFASATRRSAAATSGRRSSKLRWNASWNCHGLRGQRCRAMENEDGSLPRSIAMACSSCARRIPDVSGLCAARGRVELRTTHVPDRRRAPVSTWVRVNWTDSPSASTAASNRRFLPHPGSEAGNSRLPLPPEPSGRALSKSPRVACAS